MSVLIDTLTPLPGGVLLITLNNGTTPALSGDAALPAKWTVTGPTTVTVTDVYVSGTELVIRSTHPLQAGGVYTIGIPFGLSSQASPFIGPFSVAFTAFGDTLDIVSVASVDARIIEVVFNAAADSSALVAANYVLSGPNSPTIAAIAKVTDSVYRLTSSHQLISDVYTLTAPGVMASAAAPVNTPINPLGASYFGMATDTGVYNAAFIQALPSSAQLTTYNTSVEFNGADGAKRAFYTFPSQYGAPGAVYDVTSGFQFPFTRVASQVLVGAVYYDVYRSDYVPTQSFVTRWY